MAFTPYGYTPMYPTYLPQQDQMAQMRQQYAPQMAQMPQMAAQQPQNVQGAPIWVQGEAGAKSFLVAPGQSLVLMDSERPSFYLKSADANGVPSMRTFDYTERTAQTAPPHAEQYATRAELEEFKAQISAMIQQGQRGNRRVKEEEANEQPAV